MSQEARDPTARYVAALDRARTHQHAVLTSAVRDAIARELGLSSADLVRARAHGEEQLRRGSKFVQLALWDDAVRVLSEVELLLPDEPLVYLELARAHVGRSRAHPRSIGKEALAQARVACERGLVVRPDHAELAALLAELQRERPGAWKRTRRPLALALTLISVASLGYSVTSVLKWRAFGPSRLTCPDGRSGCELDATPNKLSQLEEAGIDLKLDRHAFTVAGDSVICDLAGRVTLHSMRELSRLRLLVRLYDASDQLLEERSWQLMPDGAVPLRRGDARAVAWKESVPLLTHRVALAVEDLHSISTGPDVLRPAVLPLDWRGVSTPPDLKVSAALRQHSVSLIGQHVAIEGVLEVENRGSTPIKALAIELQAIDANRRPLGRAVRIDPVVAGLPAMLPAERRAERFSLYAPAQAVGQTATVIAIH